MQFKLITLRLERLVKKISVQAPPGTVGADQQVSRYIQYLISKYNKFAKAEPSRKTKFSYGAISRTIESKFGAKWKLLPEEKVSEVIGYLYGRILKTRIGKSNSKKGECSYSTFEEFIAKHRF